MRRLSRLDCYGRASAGTEPGAQTDGVPRRMSADVVVEIRKDAESLLNPCRQPRRPVVQPGILVLSAVSGRAEVETHVDKRPDDDPFGCGALHVVQAERHTVCSKQCEHTFVV